MKSSKNVSCSGLWGELPPKETHKQEVITPDMIENIWRQVIDESNNTDSDYTMHKQPEFIQLPMGNTHVLNAIHLREQLRAMEEGTILSNLTVISDDNQEEYSKDTSTCSITTCKPSKKTFKNNGNIKHLRPATARGILNHAVITLLAHIGYDTASSIAVDTLTDVADHFLNRISLLLKTASEEKNYGFPDALEKVFVEANIGGFTGLHSYYKEYVLDYEKKMRQKVDKKMEQQRKLEFDSNNTKMDLDDEASNNIRFDEISEFSGLYREGTLQLLDSEMGFPTSLDAGFQMLNSLEQNELNCLKTQEVNNSPCTSMHHQ